MFMLKTLGALALRHGLTYGGGFLLAHGLLTGSQMTDLISSSMTTAGILWSVYQKWDAMQAAKAAQPAK